MGLLDDVLGIYSAHRPGDWESGETSARFGEAILRKLTGEERLGSDYWNFDPLSEAETIALTGDQPPGPWSLEMLEQMQNAAIERDYTGGGSDFIGPRQPRRRRRRKSCGAGYKRVTSCRCACKRRQHARTRRGGRRRMPAALRRYWAKHRRGRR